MTKKTVTTGSPKEQYEALKSTFIYLGEMLWQDDVHVNLYQGHLELSAGKFVKHEYFGQDTYEKAVASMTDAVSRVRQELQERRDEIDEALKSSES